MEEEHCDPAECRSVLHFANDLQSVPLREWPGERPFFSREASGVFSISNLILNMIGKSAGHRVLCKAVPETWS